MYRIRCLRATVVFVTLTLLSCASGPLPAAPLQTRPVPDASAFEKWRSGSAAGSSGRELFFIQMADTQLGMFASPLWLALFGATWNDDEFEADAELFETAVAHANELDPGFVVICGDLVHRVGHEGQIAEFQRIAATLDSSIALYLVAGNHDVENGPTLESLDAYRKAFGPDWYSFREGNVYGIVLNSQLIDAPDQVRSEAERQLSWLREELDRAAVSGAKHLLVFQHQPFFLETADEPDQYFNIEQASRAVYLELLKNAGVEAVLAGHLHRNARGYDGPLEMITTGPVGRPLGDDPSGFRIVEVGDSGLRHEYFSLD